MTCCQCEGIEAQFGAKTARRELRRYRRRGPIRSTRLLIRELRRQGVEGRTLLDVGGGIGAIQHELLEAGARSAVHVDAAEHYLAASREEAARRGHQERVEYLHGDFVELADAVAGADIVTLDRVICCYPDLEGLVTRAASRAGRLLGLVYPRVHLATRVGVPLVNLSLRLRRIPFRVYLHAPRAIDALVRAQGLEPCAHLTTPLWSVSVYRRPAP